jgi:uncharacterized damage-inducible protein DinB
MSIFTNPISAAKEAAEAYIAAVLGLLGDRDPIQILSETADALRQALADKSDEEIRRPEQPGKWSAIEVVQHLADSDLVWAYRMHQVAAEERPRLTGYDQDLWATQLDYRSMDADHALTQFEAMRSINLLFLGRLPAEAFQRVGVHTERGDESLDHMVRLYAGHDLVHLRQLDRILGSR